MYIITYTCLQKGTQVNSNHDIDYMIFILFHLWAGHRILGTPMPCQQIAEIISFTLDIYRSNFPEFHRVMWQPTLTSLCNNMMNLIIIKIWQPNASLSSVNTNKCQTATCKGVQIHVCHSNFDMTHGCINAVFINFSDKHMGTGVPN